MTKVNYCEMYLNINKLSSANELYQFKFQCQYWLSAIVSICCCVRLYSPNNVILLANSSETSRIVNAVRGFYSASPLHSIN